MALVTIDIVIIALYAVGIFGIAQWVSALSLIIVGKYFLPIFLKHKIYTMPQVSLRGSFN